MLCSVFCLVSNVLGFSRVLLTWNVLEMVYFWYASYFPAEGVNKTWFSEVSSEDCFYLYTELHLKPFGHHFSFLFCLSLYLVCIVGLQTWADVLISLPWDKIYHAIFALADYRQAYNLTAIWQNWQKSIIKIIGNKFHYRLVVLWNTLWRVLHHVIKNTFEWNEKTVQLSLVWKCFKVH